MKCMECNSKDSYIKIYHHIVEVKSETVEFDAEREFCVKCGALIYNEKLDNIATLEAIRLYNLKVGIVSDELIKLRKSYHLSQELFAKIIGCAKKTLISYELGKSVPNDIYMITLKTLITNPHHIIVLIESNKERYSEKEYNRIRKALEMFYLNQMKSTTNIFGGFEKEFNYKTKSLILELANTVILKTKLLKEMFYVDFLCYKELGHSLTGRTYLKYEHGPVPIYYEAILNQMRDDGLISYDVTYEGDYEKHQIIAKVKDDAFSKEELAIINKVATYFKDYNCSQIEKYSHDELGFKMTGESKVIDYRYAFDIKLK